jgi:hypothetical protein
MAGAQTRPHRPPALPYRRRRLQSAANWLAITTPVPAVKSGYKSEFRAVGDCPNQVVLLVREPLPLRGDRK